MFVIIIITIIFMCTKNFVSLMWEKKKQQKDKYS